MSTVRITDLNADDRPREKAIRSGIKSLSDAELLAIIIGQGLPGMSALDMSRNMLYSSSGFLPDIARMSIKELTRRFKGIGDAKAVSIAASFELGARCSSAMNCSAAPNKITGSEDAYKLLRDSMALLPYEEFRIILLSRSNAVIADRLISRGGTAATVVDPKIIMREAIDHLAAGMILVHNHPSGALSPSAEDDRLTRKIKQGAELLDIRVLDHIIITSKGFYSYNDNGRM